ncbi:DMT family transporter [Tumebacillus permanentifrigoris]|uniref:Drug/metabolite transporter (DMT)-like permease n=1 Tax=Tumebacillus permanentifrigoris TaxID=378543 RepID=A0A316D9M6_9BACL|nr:DMT family transporter [Tumebacillus permanentifrigoris]PWK13878.1 drug/metabolite transporter (DMT)-like permease [Tumebacillus permanentifrigoris]
MSDRHNQPSPVTATRQESAAASGTATHAASAAVVSTVPTVKPLPVPPIVFLIIGVLAVSFSAILIKWSSAPAAVLGLWRLVITFLILCPILFTKNSRAELRSFTLRTWVLVAASGVCLALHFILWIGSLKYTTVASSTILITLQPIFVMVLAYFTLKERTTWRAWAGAGIAIIGSLFIGWGDLRISGDALWGDLLSLLGTLTVSGYLVIGQHLRNAQQGMSSFVYSLLVYVFAILVMFFYCIGEGYPLVDYNRHEWMLFVLLAIIPTVFGHTLFNWLLKYVNAATISMAILGEPIGATILAFLLLGEAVIAAQWVGGAVIMCGIWLFLSTRDKRSFTE